MPSDATSQLSQYLDKLGRGSSISWQEITYGPAHDQKWKCVCKIDGEPRGEGTGSHKHVAKNIAAAQALQYLIEET
ncbi:hypothetical protein FA15DRAFT_267141 [Coprinopsis marcescibilis]|uniref:DRBM domain-containing protein n=1 Tax=Coprinopsis marcescibilis TaxID=230819 RepID=A0A5C3L1X1_COPMA|nr:hypothetical protein FA15DRAFT_267141 [Coprinopsis marcescibilis]